MRIKVRIAEWTILGKTAKTIEDPEVIAGREAEHYLRTVVKTNLKHKGSYCFPGKRVPSKKNKCRFEIDLIVLTKKQLHFLEIKNWSGELFLQQGQWIQKKRNGTKIPHEDLTRHNNRKADAMMEYLATNGIQIDQSHISRKVIFWNKNLRIPSEIRNNPDVVPKQKLDEYLNSQKGASVGETLIHSVIELCLASEKSKKALKQMFHALPASQVKEAKEAFTNLRTWDRLKYHGGRIIPGDALSLHTNGKVTPLKNLGKGYKIKFKWTRNRFFGLVIALLSKQALGTAKSSENWIDLTPSTDYIKFHKAGVEKPTDIPLRKLEWVVKG